MQDALAKSLIFHAALVVIILLSSMTLFARKEVLPAVTAITVDLQIAEKTNIKRAKKQQLKKKPKPKPKKKKPAPPKPKPPKEKPKEKPKPKTAEPKKEKPKQKPKPKKKEKPQDDELTSLLKSLDAEEDAPQEITQNTQDFDASKPVTRSETSAIVGKITKQIQACWNIPAGARNAADLKVLVDVDVSRDGRLKFVGFADQGKYYSDSFYAVAADSARRAILDPRCNPLKEIPPLDKYKVWGELTIEFDPQNQIY